VIAVGVRAMFLLDDDAQTAGRTDCGGYAQMPRQGAHEITAFVPRLQHDLRVSSYLNGQTRRASPDGSIAPIASGATCSTRIDTILSPPAQVTTIFTLVTVVIYDAPEAPNEVGIGRA
jgi:hypothetical protein